MDNMSNDIIDQVVNIFLNETKIAEGCTEPIAIALSCAKARSILNNIPDKIEMILSGNIIKNVKSVIVPNSGGKVGIEVAAAMGALYGDSDKELMTISQVTPDQMDIVNNFINKNSITVARADNDLKLYIKATLYYKEEFVSVELKHHHTNITEIIHNNKILLKENKLERDNIEIDPASILNIDLIYKATQAVAIDLIKNRIDQIIKCNYAIAQEGLTHRYGVNIGLNIKRGIDGGFYGGDVRNISASFAAAASDARMGGSAMPVITASGSGNIGIISTIPLIVYCQEKKINNDMLSRGLFFSILSAVYLKVGIGRLSAHCGPSIVSAGLAGALVYLNNGSLEQIKSAVNTTLSGIAGAICDGANSSCAVKIANAVYAAYDGAISALNNNQITKNDGIVGNSVEDTIHNIGKMAKDAMKATDEYVLQLMTRQ